MKKISFLKNIYIYSATLLLSPINAFAAPATTSAGVQNSVNKVLEIASALITVFTGAGIILLVYGIISMILAVKDENAEGKVTAASKIAVAITLTTISGIINALLAASGVTGSI